MSALLLANAVTASSSPCLARAHEYLTNIEGAHRVHGWPAPLRVVNVTLNAPSATVPATFQIVTMSAIGSPTPYVHDRVSTAIQTIGHWEISHPDSIMHAARTRLSSRGTFLDIGAQLGYYSLMFASIGYRVVAIEPMLQNILALQASKCHNSPGLGDQISILHAAAVSPDQQAGSSCAVLSPWRGTTNDFSSGIMECVNQTHKSYGNQCARKHNGKILKANHTYFFHYRRFCQQVLPPLKTLDDILNDSLHLSPVDIVKIDVAGAECEVLSGGRRGLFHDRRPSLLVIHTNSPRTDVCIASISTEYGYSVQPLSLNSAGNERRHVVLSDDRRK
jgi:FkbM family methyltransferase